MSIKSFGSGSLSLSEIQGEFGGSNPISMSEYYKGGYVPASGTNLGTIPSSGSISVRDFYGTSAYVPPPTLRYVNATRVVSGSDTILTFKRTGYVVLGATITLRGLVVGGGGAGGSAGNDRSGGGGGGGAAESTAAIAAGTYNVTVGNGAKAVYAGYTDYYGNPVYITGSSSGSSFGSIITAGGGSVGTNGQGNYGFGATGGASGSPQNNAGGPNGGGGGGAGAAAVNAGGYNASPGGAGKTSDITGTSTYYGGGGGGGAQPGAGGAGGGGNATGYGGGQGGWGIDGLGGGGGGSGGYGSGGYGGDGVVIIRGNITSVFGGFYVTIPDRAGGTGEGFYRIVGYWTNDTGVSQTVNLTGSVDTPDTKTLNVRGKVSTDFSIPQTGLNAGGADSPPSPYWSFGNSGNGTGRGARSISLAKNSVVVPSGSSVIVEAYLWGAYNSDHVSGTYLQITP